MSDRILLVVSEKDPVAPRVAERWGTPPSTGEFVDGAPIRALGPATWMLRRAGLHILDDGLDARLPADLRKGGVTMIFPSVHRSESGTPCLTVHPLGNPGADAEVGGRPNQLVPTDPRLMTAALRGLAEAGRSLGLDATFEATHHGPWLATPAFFAEIGFGEAGGPSADAIGALARVLPSVRSDEADRVVVGVGGGHYVPHFADLAVRRQWAFGHLLSRHALENARSSLVQEAIGATPGAEGVLFARAADAADPRWAASGPRLREADAPRREAGAP